MTLIYIVLLLVINAFFVAAEFALVKVPGIRIEAIAATGSFLGRLTLKIKSNLDPFLAACQLGITMASLGLGWLGEPAVAAVLHPLFNQLDLPSENLHTISFLCGFIIFSSLHIVVGEQVPKTFAIRSAEKVALITSAPLYAFYLVVYPINWLLNNASRSILRALGVKEASHVEIMTGVEISGLIDVSSEHGAIAFDQAQMLQNLFKFDERVVHSVMMPRSKIDYLDYSNSQAEHIEALKATRHSRLPVIDGSWENLKGVVIVNELLLALVVEQKLDLDDHLRPPQLVPESQAIRVLFEAMRSNREHLAFAVDEFGQIDGIVSLEDLLEEVVGEFDDETDDISDLNYVEKTESGWLVNGFFPLHDLTTQTGFNPSTSSAISTVSGFIMQRLQRMPLIDDVWEESGFKFTVIELEGARISRALIEIVDVVDEG